ncbi:MAG: hypothetical protein ACYDGR_16705 [Candidatus Dormibacteria bacterium]
MTTFRPGWARRLPPLVMGALALALMIAILPSSLHLPITGPGSQAEVAPVPGQGNTQANLSQLGLADSGTVGGAGESAVADAGSPPTPAVDIVGGLPPGTNKVAQQAACVGNPARQTEDPLSPPCVPFWQGDNGGVTSKGVTRSAITIILADARYGHDGDVYSDPPKTNDSPIDTTTRLLLRYFQSRFQTYGRTVRLIMDRGPGQGTAGNPINFSATDQRDHPFAVITHSTDTDPNYISNAIKSGTMVFAGTYRSSTGCAPRATLVASAP